MEMEVHNSQYGSTDATRPLYYRNYYSPLPIQPYSEIKYESFNEIHLDFSKSKSYRSNSCNSSTSNLSKNFGNSITSKTSSMSNSNITPRRATTSETSSPVTASVVFNNKYRSNSFNIGNLNSNSTLNNNTKVFTPLLPQINYPNDCHSDSSLTNTTLMITNNTITNNNNNNSLSETTSPTEITLDSPSSTISKGNSILSFNLKNSNNSKRNSIQSILEITSPKGQNSHITILDTTDLSKSNSSSHLSKTPTPAPVFKSFKNFDRLKEQQLERSSNKSEMEPTREQIIHNQFSEQFRDEFTTSSKTLLFPLSKISSSSEEIQDDPFLCPENDGYRSNELVEFDFSRKMDKKIDWTIKTDSERYISKLETKMNKVKTAPKEIVVEIPETDDIYDYDYRSSASEDSGLLNDSDSFNQPLIRRSDEGSRIRRRKHVMYTFRNNEKLITTLITLLIVVLITLIFI